MLRMRTGQRPVLLSVLPSAGRPIFRKDRQPNRPLFDSPVQISIESVRPVLLAGRTGGSADRQTVQNICLSTATINPKIPSTVPFF